MANPKKNSIHQQVMMRRASRSEYKDGLLRHNQRQENRLALELEQWEKAQRTVARGLEKESQRFKQSSSSGYNPQRGIPKRNSLTEVTENGQPRFIPDYQYRNRATIAAQPTVADYEQDSSRGDQRSTEMHENNDAEKKSSEHESSVKSHKKQSKSSEGERKKSSSKHGGDHRRSSHSQSGQKKSKSHGERESKESDMVDSAKPVSDSTTSPADKKILKSAVEAAITPVKQNHSDKTTPSKSSSKSSKKIAAAADNATLPLPTPSNTTTTTDAASTTTTTAQSGSDDARPGTASKTSSGGRAFSVCEDVHDPGDVIVSTKLLRELGWDGRRRYTNVWDSLSAPKHTSQVRSVRSRLQREFTQPPGASSDSSSKSLGGRSARTASLF